MKEIFKQLSVKIPEKYLIEYTQDNKVFKGYHAQYAIDLLNTVVGIDGWELKCKFRQETVVGKGWLVAMSGILKINGVKVSEGSSAFYASHVDNAYKGARTSTFKQCCRYIGIGSELYYQQEEDIIEVEQPQELKEIIKKINACNTLEQLKEIDIKKEDKDVYKAFNAKKLSLLK